MYRYIIKADFGLLVNIDIKHHSHQNLNLNLQNSIQTTTISASTVNEYGVILSFLYTYIFASVNFYFKVVAKGQKTSGTFKSYLIN